MFRLFNRTGLRAVMAIAFAGISSVSLASEGNMPFTANTQAQTYAFTAQKPFEFKAFDFKEYQDAMKLRMEGFATQTTPKAKKPVTSQRKASTPSLKTRIAAAKAEADKDAKRLASFDKRLAPLAEVQKTFFKGQRDKLATKANASKAKLAKLQAAAAPKYAGSGGARYHGLIAKYAAANGIPLKLAHAVVRVESAYRANARGGAGEIGLMQLKLATARGMGYRGSAKGLYDPATNIKYGMMYLGKAHKLSGGSTCGTILKYNAGHGAKSMNPISARYCSKVRRYI
ncbi:MAG: transglycosylase SLT domain-containing protein [Salaquimonas sp.]